jgi:hypothetical protein
MRFQKAKAPCIRSRASGCFRDHSWASSVRPKDLIRLAKVIEEQGTNDHQHPAEVEWMPDPVRMVIRGDAHLHGLLRVAENFPRFSDRFSAAERAAAQLAATKWRAMPLRGAFRPLCVD